MTGILLFLWVIGFFIWTCALGMCVLGLVLLKSAKLRLWRVACLILFLSLVGLAGSVVGKWMYMTAPITVLGEMCGREIRDKAEDVKGDVWWFGEHGDVFLAFGIEEEAVMEIVSRNGLRRIGREPWLGEYLRSGSAGLTPKWWIIPRDGVFAARSYSGHPGDGGRFGFGSEVELLAFEKRTKRAFFLFSGRD